MRNLILTFLAVVFVAFIGLCISGLFAARGIEEIENKYKAEVGKTFTLEKDTLVITDYSLFDETFTLSNGNKVSSTLIFKQK